MSDGRRDSCFFAITRDASGFWIEYSRLGREMKTIGPFGSARDARKAGERRGWALVETAGR